MAVANCKRCKRVFQMTISPFCPECLEKEHMKSSDIYQYIQDNPGVSVGEIAAKFDLPAKEVETMVFSGSLGTANQLVKTHCNRCGKEMSALDRKGHFCTTCRSSMEGELEKTKEESPEEDVRQVHMIDRVRNRKEEFKSFGFKTRW